MELRDRGSEAGSLFNVTPTHLRRKQTSESTRLRQRVTQAATATSGCHGDCGLPRQLHTVPLTNTPRGNQTLPAYSGITRGNTPSDLQLAMIPEGHGGHSSRNTPPVQSSTGLLQDTGLTGDDRLSANSPSLSAFFVKGLYLQ